MPLNQSNKLLLLVNSHEERLQALQSLLQDNTDCRVIAVRSGSEAVAELRKQPVDIVISNITLKDLDGWRLARMVRSGVFKCAPDVPFILVANTWCEHIAELTAREFGISALLSFDEREQLIPLVNSPSFAHTSQTDKFPLLVIEDNPDTQQLVSRILKYRFDVEIAEDGEQGLAKWKENKYPLVLLDVMLPKMSGPQVLAEILKVDPRQSVVIMTAHSSMELAEDLMLKGAADFIAKPFRSEQLRKVCESASRREDFMISNDQFAEKVRSLETSRKKYKSVMDAHQHLLDQLGSVVIEIDKSGNIQFLNKAWEKFTDYTIEEAIGKPFCDFIIKHNDDDYFHQEFKALQNERVSFLNIEFQLQTKQNHALWVDARFDITHKASANEKVISGTIDDISDKKKAQDELRYLAMHDNLTGLYNRHFFETELREFASLAKEGNRPHALLYIDLDHFKVINDTVGHHLGDNFLKNIANLLRDYIRPVDILCRVGGDEFALILPNTSSEKAQVIGNQLCRVLANYQCKIEDQVFHTNASIGISEIDGDATRAEEYMKQADIALYAAKNQGRNMAHLFDNADAHSKELKASLEWARRLHQAVANDNLVLYFQPIVEVQTLKTAYYEALVRLVIDDQIITPGEFIPALERAGDMDLLDKQVIKKAIHYLSENPDLERISINLSAQGFSDKRLVPYIENQLIDNMVDANRIVFELTESASLTNITETKEIILQLRNLGCGFSIDDFGTGFSTFNYLKQLPAESVKIDGSFIIELANNTVDQALVKAISEVATALNKYTIAEYVENEATLNVLNKLGITYAQGYHLGKPKPIGEVDFST